VDTIGMKTSSNCSGDGMVSFRPVELREVDLDVY